MKSNAYCSNEEKSVTQFLVLEMCYILPFMVQEMRVAQYEKE
jgi:hypothetical protein